MTGKLLQAFYDTNIVDFIVQNGMVHGDVAVVVGVRMEKCL